MGSTLGLLRVVKTGRKAPLSTFRATENTRSRPIQLFSKQFLRLAQLLEELGDDDLLTSLVKCYTQAHNLAEYIQVSSDDAPQGKMNKISLSAGWLMESGDAVQPLLQGLIRKL
jgi:hypothetical protein